MVSAAEKTHYKRGGLLCADSTTRVWAAERVSALVSALFEVRRAHLHLV